MGVKGLWNILSELAERKELKHLKGKKVAIDLSGWIVQALQCKGLNTAKNPHLRNLFFRLLKLLKNGCLPIFVTEGEIPKIKEDTFKERNHYEKSNNCKNVSRKKFNRKAKECEELLKSLGVPCIKSSGEGEALCAFLCANHVVDGVITEDSDAFLYGADPVFRDFTVDSSDSHINQYSLKSEKNKRKLDRNKLIGLALLLGCDYLKGVSGIGEKAALDLISELSDCDVLQRFKDWKILKDFELFPGYEADSPKKLSHCTRCNHTGHQ